MNGEYLPNEPLQELLYKGVKIQFKVKQVPGNINHLTSIADNYFSTRKVEEMII